MTEKYSNNKLWKIKRYTERYAQSANARQPLILLPGWSCDSRIFEWLIPGLAQHFVIVSAEINPSITFISNDLNFDDCCTELSELLLPEFTQPVHVLGWSLGGNVAIQLASIAPQRFASLCLMATTPVFVNKPGVDWAMPDATFESFQQLVIEQPEKGLKQFDRLMLAAKSRAFAKPLRASLNDYRQQQSSLQNNWDDKLLNKGLEFLAQLDQRDALQTLQQSMLPIQALLFEDDALVNKLVAAQYKKVEIIEGASHLGFLTHADFVYNTCLTLQHDYDVGGKASIASSFSNAAPKYDAASGVQKKIAAKLLQRLESSITNKSESPRYIVDAGCGTGLWTEQLCAYAEHVTGVDLAEGMLNYAKAKHPKVGHWCQADLEMMPLVAGQSDYIFSSLAVQWCDDFQAMLAHWYSLLKPGGEVLLATLSTDTLYELAECFSHIDRQSHVNDFHEFQQLQNYALASGFECIDAKQEHECEYYETAVALMHDLKAIGAHTVKTKNGVVRPKPMTKSQLSIVADAYETFRSDEQLLPATYDVVYLHLKKPL